MLVAPKDTLDFCALLPDSSAFEERACSCDIKLCPPTPKRVRRTSRSADLDDPKTLIHFTRKDEKMRCSDFIWETGIGSGAFTESWRVRRSQEKYAVNKSKHKLASLKERRALVASFDSLKRLLSPSGNWHPHIVNHYSVWQEKGFFFVQAELCEHGDLAKLFDKKWEQRTLTEADVWEVVRQILPTLVYMHDCGVLHMDVKPDNIYVTSNNIIKLGDFGTAVCQENWATDGAEHEGDAAYLAPEVLRKAWLSPAADLFSFGMTLHRIVTGSCVHTDALADESSILKNPRFSLSQKLEQLIRSLLSPRDQDRPQGDVLLSLLDLTRQVVLKPEAPQKFALPRQSSIKGKLPARKLARTKNRNHALKLLATPAISDT